MPNSVFFNKYKSLFDSLKIIVASSRERVLGIEPDKLFEENVNFFVKSYLVCVCTYLEAYLQDVALNLSADICERFNSARIPHNFVCWKTSKEVKDKDLRFTEAIFSISRKELADELSANPYKTIRVFRFLGVDLTKDSEFKKYKDVVNSIVSKRNSIVHQNDVANDISFDDIEVYANIFIDYMSSIDKAMFKGA